MDRETVTGRLAVVESHLAIGEKLIAEQRLARASRNGQHAAAEAEAQNLEEAQIRYHIERAQLVAGPVDE